MHDLIWRILAIGATVLGGILLIGVYVFDTKINDLTNEVELQTHESYHRKS